MPSHWPALLLVAALLMVGGACDAPGPPERGAGISLLVQPEADPPVAVPPLQLLDQTGHPFHLSDLQGDVAAVFWGYLNCPDVCPMTLATLAQARRELDQAERRRFHVIMVTVDPERDDPPAMARSLTGLDPTFIGLSGAPEAVRRAIAAWGVAVEREDRPDGSYAMAHPSQVMLIDRDGRWAASTELSASPADIAATVRALLARPRSAHQAPLAAAATWILPRRSGRAPSAWLLSRADGSVGSRTVGGTTEILAPWSRREPLDRVDPGTTLGAPVIGYDPVTDRLWYSDTHTAIRSRGLVDGQAGPTLSSFTDTAIPGCGVATSGRVFALDPVRRRLYAPLLTGQVLAYDLDSLEVRGSIPAAAFPDLALGRYRPLAVDPGAGLWVLDGQGNALEFDPDHARPTGRRIAARAKVSALAVDAGQGRLLLWEPTGLRVLGLRDLSDLTPGEAFPAALTAVVTLPVSGGVHPARPSAEPQVSSPSQLSTALQPASPSEPAAPIQPATPRQPSMPLQPSTANQPITP